MSRVKNYKDFLIQPFPLDRLSKIKKSSSLPPRVEEENRIKKIVNSTLTKHNHLIKH